MSDTNLIMILGKVIVAAAWADGKVTREELNSLKDLLFRLPKISARQWAELDMYVESPIDEAERIQLIDRLRAAITSPEDQDLVRQALKRMIAADGLITEAEEQVSAEVEAVLDALDESFFSQLTRLVNRAIDRRTEMNIDTPNREEYLEEFIRNKVYYDIRRRLDRGEIQLDLPEEKLRKLGLAGGMMAQVARVNAEITDKEFYTIVEALQDGWQISREDATLVAEVAVSDTTINMDYYRMARQFVKVCSREECIRFIDVLFAVAAADGEASYQEIENIRTIAQTLLLTNEQFIEAKQKVPRQQREQ